MQHLCLRFFKTLLRWGYTGQMQLCCYNGAIKLQATNRIVCHRRYLLHATTFVARNMLPRTERLSIPCNFVAMKHQRRRGLLVACNNILMTHWVICCLQLLCATKLPSVSPPLDLLFVQLQVCVHSAQQQSRPLYSQSACFFKKKDLL